MFDCSEGDDQFGKWKVFEQPFPEGVDTLPAPNINFTVDHPDALEWDYYDSYSSEGMWSQRAKDLLWPYTNGCLRCFQATLNGAPYYILRLNKEAAIDCLDHEQSEFTFWDQSLGGDIMDITKYVFRMQVLSDPLIFKIPERKKIFCTQSIRQIVLDAGLKGFWFWHYTELYR